MTEPKLRRITAGELLPTRRQFLGASLVTAAGLAATGRAYAKGEQGFPAELIAHPPGSFVPLDRRGEVVRVVSTRPPEALMQPNRLWPLGEVARTMLEAALVEFTKKRNAPEALRCFLHPDDVVAVKVNGIAGPNMATNFELLLPLVEWIIELGVPPERITVYEQHPSFLRGTRIGLARYQLPAGVRTRVHRNTLASMEPIEVVKGIPTRYVRFLTEATAIVNVSLIKDHKICGYTGALKNMTHGSIVNPEYHHRHQANPQIAQLYAHPILRSRMRLHITDGFKLIYDGGPLDTQPHRRILHGAVHVATDPVALDTIGAELVEAARKGNRLPSLAGVGREPKYLRAAHELGVGEGERERIHLREISV